MCNTKDAQKEQTTGAETQNENLSAENQTSKTSEMPKF